jgi:hypothetical protein
MWADGKLRVVVVGYQLESCQLQIVTNEDVDVALVEQKAFVIARDGTEWGRKKVFGHGKNLESLIEHMTIN